MALEGDNLSLLAVSEARLTSLLNTAVDGIIVIGEQGDILVFNTACERMFGYQNHEVLGKNVLCLMPVEHASQHDQYLRSYRETGTRKIIGIGREVRGQRKDGSSFPLELSVGEAHTPEGRQFIGILRDISLRKETEERLSALQADFIRLARMSEIDEMGVTVAHEINQPLTAITLYLQALQRLIEEGGNPQKKDLLVKAMEQTRRVSDIIARIRKQVEQRAPERLPISLAKIVEEALNLAFLGQGKYIRIDNQVSDHLPMVEVDSVQIQQIIVNLLRNAFEATHDVEEPCIRLEAEHQLGMIILAIEDNGHGLSPEIEANLFEAFHTTKKKGMGLGLSISRLIAQRHGGELTYCKSFQGTGARFCLKLPIHGP